MKDRAKDAIILLAAFGGGMAGLFATFFLGMSTDTGAVVAGALFLFTGWKVKNEMDSVLDQKCPKCRFANANEANFCRNCGAVLRDITTIPKQEELVH
ncbi:MAG: zinc ribbon domain-containing protein [Thaumarchaeota archaeon]|nr:zinc ribbon domain-containing protein [Nitrososphaerota archaeon]